jgi:O-antigen/teichoic acid export membrane protein
VDEQLDEARAVDVLATRQAGDRVIRGGGLRAVTYVVGLVLGVAVTPFVVRHLGVEDFGRFVTVLSLIFIVNGVTEGGLANVGVREYSTRDAAGGRRLIGDLVGLRLVLTLIGCVVAISFALAAGYVRVQVEGTLIACAGVVLLGLQNAYAIPLSAGLRLGWLAALDFLRQAATTLLMLGLVIAGASLLPFFVVAPVAGVLMLALTVSLVRREALVAPRADPAAWLALLRETLYYAAATALAVVYFQLALIFTSLVSSALQTGYYAVAFRIIDIANGVPWLLVTSAFPILARAAHDDRERLRYALQRIFEVALILGVWFALAIVLGARFAVDVVAGADSHASIAVLQILGLGAPATFLIATWSFALLSVRQYRGLLVANGIAIVVQVAVTLPLASAHGARGAAIGALVTELTLAAAYGIVLMRAHADLRPGPGIVPRVALAAAPAAGLGALALTVHPVVAVVVATVVYFAALAAQRAIPTEVLDALRQRRAAATE